MGRGRKGKEYSDDQMHEAVSMYADASISYSRILEVTGIPQLVLDRYLAQNGMEKIRRKTRHRSKDNSNDKLINELIFTGKSVKAISEQLHITVNTVKNHMSEEAWNVYLSNKRRGRAPKARNLTVEDKLKITKKMYMDTQLSFQRGPECNKRAPKISKKIYINT